jgi:hypothetical protein
MRVVQVKVLLSGNVLMKYNIFTLYAYRWP